jgi:SET domain-containing protein|tara:strand:- start:388 stop:708 length:321 start_codon:yes stop_codon:yes gene_type:complete
MANITHNDKYNPLPFNVSLRDSTIHGYGLFSKWAIPYNEKLGMIHFYVDKFEIIRTPLGGFLNHSVTPNCRKVIEDTNSGKRAFLYTDTEILCGEELTITYDLYKV